MRYSFIGLATLIALTVGGILVYREITAGPPVVLPAPTQIRVSPVGTAFSPDGWTSSRTLMLNAAVPAGIKAGLDVEARPEGQAFSDTPTATESAAQAVGSCSPPAQCLALPRDPTIAVRLPDGEYHLQARLHNGRGVSPWMAYKRVVRIDTVPPAAPRVSSSTNPDPKKIYHGSALAFAWQSSDAGSGIAGYSYRLDTDPKGSAREELRIGGTSVKLVGLDTGTYYFHVRALDRAGNWGPNSTFPVRIDVTPPGLAHVNFNLFQFDPQFDALRVSFAVTRAATTVRMGVYRQSDQQLVRLYKLTHLTKGQTTSVAWDGKDALGRPAQAGSYEIYIRAIDRFGHSSVTGWRDFVVDYRRIVVSLSQQKLVAYDGNRVLLTSLVTTGNRALPTPKGTFRILAKFSPFTFRSPWPKSSPYYYPPSKVQYAMLFQAGGYFVHDAPWRSAFGPGTNSQLGTPGSNYTGTHGCVNVPPDVAQRLFAWTHVGTVVQVVA